MTIARRFALATPRWWPLALAAALMAALACDDPMRPDIHKATILIQLARTTPAASTDSDSRAPEIQGSASAPAQAFVLDNMTVLVRGPSNRDVPLTKNANGHWTGPVQNVAPGAYELTLEGRTGNEVTYRGNTSVSVGAGETKPATISNLACVTFACISLSRSTVTVSSPSIASGSTSTVTLLPVDAAGAGAKVPGLTVVFTRSEGGSTWTTGAPVYDATTGSYKATWTGVLAGAPATIGATVNGSPVTSTSPTQAVTPGTASKLAFTTQPVTAAIGTPLAPAIQVTAQDAAGNTVTAFSGNVTITIGSNPANGALSGTATSAAVNGIATFSNLSITGLGLGYTLSATATGLTAASSAPFDITGEATRLVFTVQPTDAVSLAVITPALQLTAQDESGNTITTFTGDVTIALGSNPGAGTLSGSATVAAVNGVASFPALTINKAAAGYTLVASATGLVPVTSSPFAIIPGSAQTLAFTVQPVSTVSGTSITPAVRVRARDLAQNTATSFTGNVTITLGANPGGGTLSGTTSVAASNGVATFSSLSINNLGSGYTLVATAAGLTDATSTTFNVTAPAGTVTTLTVSPGGASITGGSQTFSAQARDGNGDLVPGASIAWSSLNPAVATIDASSGVATALASGQTIIAASTNGITAFALLTVAITTATPANAWTSSAILPTTGIERGFFTLSASSIYALGASGKVVRWNGTSWTLTQTATTAYLYAIWGSSGSDLFAVGDNGAIQHFNGTAWAAMTSGTSQTLQAVWGASPRDVYASGEGGTLLHFDGSSWSSVPSGSTATLTRIWGSSSSDVFVTASGGAVLHYDGSTWSSSNVTNQNLYGLWGFGPTDVFAVGTNGFLFHYNGAWSSVTSSSASGLTNGATLYSVWGTSGQDLYAAGASFAVCCNGLLTGVVYRLNTANGQWVETDRGGLYQNFGITGFASANLLVIGDHGSGDPDAVREGVRGAKLAFTTQPSNVAAGAAISPAVRVAARDAADNTLTNFTGNITLAIGTNPASGTLSGTTTVGAVNGIATFSNLSINNSGTGYTLTAASPGIATITSTAFNVTAAQGGAVAMITVTPGGAALAGGTQTFTAQARDGNGAIVSATFTWSSLSPAVATINSSNGVATAVASGQTIIAATAGSVTGYALLTVAVTASPAATLWSSSDVLPANGIERGFLALSATAIYALGSQGRVARWNGSSWTLLQTGSSAYLRAIWGSAPSDLFAVGNSGTIQHFDGSNWTAMTSGTTQALQAVWGASPRDVYAAGDAGTLLHFDGSTWSPVQSGTTADITRVWGSSSVDVFATTSGGTVLRYTGSTWSGSSITNQNLYGLWGFGPTDVYAVGSNGFLFHYNGSWSTVTSSSASGLTNGAALYSVWGTSGQDLYAAGASFAACCSGPLTGVVYRLNTTTNKWVEVDRGGLSQNFGVIGFGNASLFVTGDHGSGSQQSIRTGARQ